MLNRWINILTEVVEPAARGGRDEPSQIAAHLLGIAAQPPVDLPPLTPSRREHRRFLAYARRLAQGVPWPRRSDRPRHTESTPSHRAADAPGLIDAMYRSLEKMPGGADESAVLESLFASHNGRSFTTPSGDDQLEAWWFHELVLLHGLASYAVLAHDARAWGLMHAGAAFHRAEIQADHATADPWAIHAFIFNPQANDVADGLLNACMIQYGGEPRGVALVLLADALYCLRHVAKHGYPESV